MVLRYVVRILSGDYHRYLAGLHHLREIVYPIDEARIVSGCLGNRLHEFHERLYLLAYSA